MAAFIPQDNFYQDKGRQIFQRIFFSTFASDLKSPQQDKKLGKIFLRSESVTLATFHAFVESNTYATCVEIIATELKTWGITKNLVINKNMSDHTQDMVRGEVGPEEKKYIYEFPNIFQYFP